MSDNTLFPVPNAWAERAWCNDDQYLEMYEQSVKDPKNFWGQQGKRIDWFKPYTTVKNVSYDPHNVSIKWFEDGTLNASYNCIDRHLEKRADQTASMSATKRASAARPSNRWSARSSDRKLLGCCAAW